MPIMMVVVVVMVGMMGRRMNVCKHAEQREESRSEGGKVMECGCERGGRLASYKGDLLEAELVSLA